MATGFISYSHKDEALKDHLLAHLAPLRREGSIDAWHDRKVAAGDRFDRAISSALESADVILLLVSSDFINSDYCYDVELRRAMERHEHGDAVVVPVILRACAWQGTPFGRLRATPRDGKAITSWTNQDEAFHDVAQAVRDVLNRATNTELKGAAAHEERRPAQTDSSRAASSIRLPRRFSEKNKDDFLEEVFDHIAQFFQSSLTELERENRGVETKFRRLDAVRFTGVAYRDGQAVSRCTIWMGGRQTFVGGIGYVENDSGQTSGLNESLSVEADEQTLYLKALGMPIFGQSGVPAKMSAEAAAEYLWGLFLRRLRQSS